MSDPQISSVPISITITPGAIEQSLIDAVLKSQFGARLKYAVESWLNDAGSYKPSLDSKIGSVVDQEVRNVVVKWIQDNYIETIREKVRAKLTDEFTSKVIDNVVTKVLRVNEY